jgi:hypothetical protein
LTQVETLTDAMTAMRAGKPVRLLFAWAHLRAVGIGYAMAIIAKARAAYPQTECQAVLDAGEDAGLALSALKSGANLVLFSGAPQVTSKLAQIATQLGADLQKSAA